MSIANESIITPIVSAASSPRHVGGDSVNSPQSRRSMKAGSSPWTQIVSGESEPNMAIYSSPSGSSSTVAIESGVAASVSAFSSSSSMSASFLLAPDDEYVGASETLESSGGSDGNAGKKPVWNKPSNGALEVGPVMGAVSWPELSESTKTSSKPSESSKDSSDISTKTSVSELQVTGTGTTGSYKPSTSNFTAIHLAPARQRAMKRNNSNISFNGGLPQQQVAGGQFVEMAPSNPSTKDNTQRSGSGSLSHSGSDHPQHRNSFRNRNGGPQRRDGSHHHNYGGRRDQDRGNHELNGHRNHSGRDNHMQHQRLPRYYRGPTPPHGSTPFVPPPMQSYNPMGFTDLGPVPLFYVPAPHPDPFRLPLVAPMQPPYFAVPDPQLHTKILNQINYYFSNENLIKDTYLRQNMDEQGWVSIKLIAGFNKVMQLTDNIQVLLEALRMSSIVEVQGDKLRRRNDWMKWLMPPIQFPNVSSSQVQSSPQTLRHGHDALAARVGSITLEENAEHTSVQNNSQLQLFSGDMISQFCVQGGADHSI